MFAAMRPPALNEGLTPDRVEAWSPGVVRKSVRADIGSEERRSSRRSIYFASANEGR
jgi:hypothetical protein